MDSNRNQGYNIQQQQTMPRQMSDYDHNQQQMMYPQQQQQQQYGGYRPQTQGDDMRYPGVGENPVFSSS